MPGEGVATFDLTTVLRFADLALTALGEAREEIDALNVYPVPDGDTGTNLYLTVEAARGALVDAVGGDESTSPSPADLSVTPLAASSGPGARRLARLAVAGWRAPTAVR